MRKCSRFITCLKILGTLFLCCLYAAPATASFLSFSPSFAAIQPGTSIRVDIFFSDPEGTRVGEFDLFVNYDPDVLVFDTNDVMFGPGLGGGTNSFQAVSEDVTGRVNISELSLLADIPALQDGTSDLLLLSMTFDASGIGDSMVTLFGGIGPDAGFLGDENGVLIPLDRVEDAIINVVPIPGAVSLMAVGLACLFGLRHRPRRHTSE